MNVFSKTFLIYNEMALYNIRTFQTFTLMALLKPHPSFLQIPV